MSLFATPFYADSYYGGDENNYPPGGPANLTAYQNNIFSVVLYWSLKPCTPAVHDFVWTVETDLVSTFDSANLLTFVSTDPGVMFIAGRVNKGIVIDVPYPRKQGVITKMHWRVRGTLGSAHTIYVSSVFDILQAWDGVTRDMMLDLQPDPIYRKDAGSNNYKILDTYGKTIDDYYVQDMLANNDIYTASVRDINLQPLFGDYIHTRLPAGMKAIDYREIVRSFFVEARNSPRTKSISKVVDAALCEPSKIIAIRDILDLVVADDAPGQQVNAFYVPDDGFYQTISFDGPLVADNIHTVSVDAFSVVTNFNSSSDTTMSNIAANIAARPGVASAIVREASPGNRRIISILATTPGAPPLLSSSVVTGGAFRAHAIINAYQTITFDAKLVLGNAYAVTVGIDRVSTTFTALMTGSDVAMAAIASNLAAHEGIASAHVVPGDVLNDARVIILLPSNPLNPQTLSNSIVTGGASQANTVLSAAGQALPSAVWDNVHLAGGIVVQVENPLGAIVSKMFLQDILRKLVMANNPLYVTGIV